MLKFRPAYFILTIILFITEICIANFFHDGFIRNNLGDFLVVILIYCFIRSFFNLSVLSTSIAALLFSYAVEVSQYFKFVEKLGLQNSKIARILIGTSFEWADILAYTLESGFVLLIEKLRSKT
ncbi:MAG: DUF2809 domain-containing protein [Bacteroidota bacterium]